MLHISIYCFVDPTASQLPDLALLYHILNRERTRSIDVTTELREAICRKNLLLFGFFQNGLDPPPCVFNRPGVVGAVLQSPPSLIN